MLDWIAKSTSLPQFWGCPSNRALCGKPPTGSSLLKFSLLGMTQLQIQCISQALLVLSLRWAQLGKKGRGGHSFSENLHCKTQCFALNLNFPTPVQGMGLSAPQAFLTHYLPLNASGAHEAPFTHLGLFYDFICKAQNPQIE